MYIFLHWLLMMVICVDLLHVINKCMLFITKHKCLKRQIQKVTNVWQSLCWTLCVWCLKNTSNYQAQGSNERCYCCENWYMIKKTGIVNLSLWVYFAKLTHGLDNRRNANNATKLCKSGYLVLCWTYSEAPVSCKSPNFMNTNLLHSLLQSFGADIQYEDKCQNSRRRDGIISAGKT